MRHFFSLLILLILPRVSTAQAKPGGPEQYLELAAHLGYSAFRDQGVSPLLYEGFLLLGGGRYTEQNGRWSGSFEVLGGVGFYDVTRQAVYESTSVNFAYGGHTRYAFWESDRLRMRYEGGVRFHGFTNIRSNPNLLNATTGVESLNTLFVSNQLTWQWVRPKKMQENEGEPVRRRLWSFELNLPLLNTAWLTDYAYIVDFTDGESTNTDEHSLHWGGWRMQTRLSYQHFLHNGNALRFTYWWDYLRTPESFNQLEFVNGAFEFALVYRLN